MSDRGARSWRGFSLLELMVAIAIAIALMALVMQILVDAESSGRRTRVRAELAANAVIASQMLRNDLVLAGLGVPSGVDQATASKQFSTSMLVASPTSFGMVGDLARPDANFNTFGFITDEAAGGGNDHHVSWLTENNGPCLPGSARCNTADFSMFFPGENGCASPTSASGATPDRTCPWGLKRLRGGEPFQVVAGNRRWFNANNKNPIEAHNHGAGIFIHTGNSFPSGWDANSATSLPNAGAGQGWVTTLDRVFWRYNSGSRQLERIQCWGHPDPSNALWPAATATAVPAAPCGAPFEGQAAFDVVAKNVDAVSFTYFDAAGNAVTNPATASAKQRIRSVEFKLTLARDVGGKRVEHEQVGGVFLANAL
jgi:type II secretory pathway pseudopilin PulG